MNDHTQNNRITRPGGVETETKWHQWYGLTEEEKLLKQYRPSWWTKPRDLNDEEKRDLERHQEKIKMTLQFECAGGHCSVNCVETNNLLEMRNMIHEKYPKLDNFSFKFKADGQILNCQEECRTHAFQLRLLTTTLHLVRADESESDSSYSENSNASMQKENKIYKRLSEQGTKLSIFSNNVMCEMYCLEHHTLADIRFMIPHVLHPCQLPAEREHLLPVGHAKSFPGAQLNRVRPDVPFTFEVKEDGPILYAQKEDRITLYNLYPSEGDMLSEDGGKRELWLI